jgi:hypothetical protein
MQDQVLRSLIPTAAMTNVQYSDNNLTTDLLSRQLHAESGTGLQIQLLMPSLLATDADYNTIARVNPGTIEEEMLIIPESLLHPQT